MEPVTMLPHGRPLTYVDLESMPHYRHRYELIDGSLIVTPAPSRGHQIVHSHLMDDLLRDCPQGLRVLAAPVDVRLADDLVFQPDLLVVDAAEFAQLDQPARPLLVVEILSPSTSSIDRLLKFNKFQAAGCPSYWIVDPDEPRLTAWDLVDGAYLCVGDVAGDSSWTSTLPYSVTVTPAELIR